MKPTESSHTRYQEDPENCPFYSKEKYTKFLDFRILQVPGNDSVMMMSTSKQVSYMEYWYLVLYQVQLIHTTGPGCTP